MGRVLILEPCSFSKIDVNGRFSLEQVEFAVEFL